MMYLHHQKTPPPLNDVIYLSSLIDENTTYQFNLISGDPNTGLVLYLNGLNVLNDTDFERCSKSELFVGPVV